MPQCDASLILTVLGVALAGGLIGLDRTAVGQFLFSQPVVVAPLTGWLLGDTTAGVVIGVALELIWVLDMPVGAFVPADATIGALFATAIAVLGGRGAEPLPVEGVSILLATALVPITMRADGIVRVANARFFPADAGRDDRALARAQAAGLAVFFLKTFVLLLVSLPFGIAAIGLFLRLPAPAHRAMTVFVTLLPLLGAAAVVRKMSVRTLDRFVVAGFAAALLCGSTTTMPAWSLLALAAMLGWVGARWHERRT